MGRVFARAVFARGTIRRATNCGSPSASSKVAIGVTQQSTGANRAVHSARVASRRLARARCERARPRRRPRTGRRRDRDARSRRTAPARTCPPVRPREPAPVPRRVDPVAGDAAGEEVLASRQHVSPLLERVEREDVVRKRRVGHRDVDVTPAPGPPDADQRCEKRDRRGRRAAEQVGDLQMHNAGGPPRTPVWSSTPA